MSSDGVAGKGSSQEALAGEGDWTRLVTGVQRHPAPVAAIRPVRIVCLGGGTGLPVVLKGLSRGARLRHGQADRSITAIVVMSDDGGSSGRLRRSRGSLPPGDIRRCLVALARGHPELSQVFQYRFAGKSGLAGHTVGNLLITAMAELKGNFLEAIRVSADFLGVRGTVLPCTLFPVELVAYKADDACVVGESNIARIPGRVLRVSLHPKAPPAAENVVDAIESADLISIGPGSLYSSILPNLLVDGVISALKRARALKVLIANLMTQPGETDGMDCADHLRALIDHVGPVIDVMLVNSAPLPAEAVQRYAGRGSVPLSFDRAAVLKTGVIPVEADLLREGLRIRHDGRKLARRLMRIARSGL